MKIALLQGFPFHYEMLGFMIHYAVSRSHRITIYTRIFQPEVHDPHNYIAWYKKIYPGIEWRTIHDWDDKKHDAAVLLSHWDPHFSFTEPHKLLVIDHNENITDAWPDSIHVTIRPFDPGNQDEEWVLPVYPISITHEPPASPIRIAVIGYGAHYFTGIFNRIVWGNPSVEFELIGRHVRPYMFDDCPYQDKFRIHKDLSQEALIELVSRCHYILADVFLLTHDHENRHMSGCVPLAFSLRVPLILSKQTNRYYRFRNVVEFDKHTGDPIVLHTIDPSLLQQEFEEMLNKNERILDLKFSQI